MSLSVIFRGFLYHPSFRQIMDASVFLSHAKKALGDRAWSAELVLHVGADLAQAVNSLKNLSGKDKSELVCQTILKLLDDGEKAEKERAVESTGKEMTKVPWDGCRHVVKTLLPASLELLVKASRGEISLPKEVKQIVSCFSRLPLSQIPCLQLPWLQMRLPQLRLPQLRWPAFSRPVPLPSKDHFFEVRDLVLRVEKMLKEAQALPEVKAAQLARLHPPAIPAPTAVLLPGELPIHVEVSEAQ